MESLRKAGRRIIHMHLADNNSRVPGRGIIDFSKLFQCFREIGYKDAVSIEARFTDDPREELRFALEVLAKSFSNVS
jgi:sugar phosphate isomerase/epimerase